MKRWVSFKANAGTFKKTSYATIGRIAADLGSRRLAFAEIRGNTGREFVSHFAMVSPIEDFVETYRYMVLGEPLKALRLRFPPPTAVPASAEEFINVLVPSPESVAKRECVQKFDLLAVP